MSSRRLPIKKPIKKSTKKSTNKSTKKTAKPLSRVKKEISDEISAVVKSATFKDEAEKIATVKIMQDAEKKLGKEEFKKRLGRIESTKRFNILGRAVGYTAGAILVAVTAFSASLLFSKVEDDLSITFVHDTIGKAMTWLKDASTVEFDKFLDYWNPKLDGPSRASETLAEIRDRSLTVNQPSRDRIVDFWNRNINAQDRHDMRTQHNPIRVLAHPISGTIQVHPQSVDDYYTQLRSALLAKRLADAEAITKSASQANVSKLQKRAFEPAPLPAEIQDKIFSFLKPKPPAPLSGRPIRYLHNEPAP